MKLLAAAFLVFACAAAAFAADVAPAPYYSLNPYDDVMVGPGFVLRDGDRRLELGLGYSLGQREGRGRLRYRDDTGLGARTGYELTGFHEMRAQSDLVPLFQTGYYEGRTGGAFGIFHRLNGHDTVTLSLTADRVWDLPARGDLLPTTSDRVHSIGLGYRHDTRDDVWNPRTGERTELAATQAVRVFGGTRAYTAAHATRMRYREWGENGVLAHRLHAVGTSGTVPLQRQIWLPGAGVRGYEFVSANGNVAAVANAEVRLPLLNREEIDLGPLATLHRLQWAAFADLGTVRGHDDNWRVRGGVGLGLRVPLTAFGQLPMVMRLDAAQGLTDDGMLKGYLLLTAPELF